MNRAARRIPRLGPTQYFAVLVGVLLVPGNIADGTVSKEVLESRKRVDIVGCADIFGKKGRQVIVVRGERL